MVIVDDDVSGDGFCKKLLDAQSDVYAAKDRTLIFYDVQASCQMLTFRNRTIAISENMIMKKDSWNFKLEGQSEESKSDDQS